MDHGKPRSCRVWSKSRRHGKYTGFYTIILGKKLIFYKWPYTYDSCDVGTAPNQTRNGQPYAATVNGDPSYNDALSWLPGQRLSRCTCDGESHPGPKHPDGTYVGRSAPEIDVFEAQVFYCSTT